MHNDAYEKRWWSLLVLSLAVLVVILSSSTISVALPSIQKELGASMSDLQWMMNAYMLAFASFMLIAGWLGERLGKKRVLLSGLLLFAIANGLAFLADDPYELIALRALMGSGSALVMPLTLAIIADLFPEEERGKAIGLWAGMNSLGIAMSPIVGGLLVQSYGWKAVFWVNLPVSALALLAAFFLVPRGCPSLGGRLDLRGSLLSTLGLASLIFGLTRSGTEGWGDAVVLACIGLGLASIFLFVRLESRASRPLFDLSLFRSEGFGAYVVGVGLMSLGLVGITFALTLYLQFVRGYTPLEAGYRSLPLALGVFLGAGFASRLANLAGSRALIVAGFLGSAAASLTFAFLGAEESYTVFGLILAALSICLGLIAATSTTGLMACLPQGRNAMGSAMNNVVRTVAGAVGVAVFGSILSSVYAASFDSSLAATPSLSALPGPLLEAARDSVGAAIKVGERLPEPLRSGLSRVAREGFMEGWHLVAWISAGINAAAALFAFASLPRRSGRGPAEMRPGA